MEKKSSLLKTRNAYIQSYYESNLGASSEHYKILGWENRQSQLIRFSILLKNVSLENKSLLDFGCGMADLYAFLLTHGNTQFDYTGVDISEKIILEAKKIYPGLSLFAADLTEEALFENCSFDVLYSSGIFNLKIEDNMSFFKDTFGVFFSLAGKTIVFNLLSDKSEDKEETFHYFSRNEIEDFLRTWPLASIEIVDDYLTNDFTVICEKVKNEC